MKFKSEAIDCHFADRCCISMTGGMRLAGTPARIASFEYVVQPEEAAAIRRISYAPGLDFNALVTGVLEGEGSTEEGEEAEEGEPGEAQAVSQPRRSTALSTATPIIQHEGADVSLAHQDTSIKQHLMRQRRVFLQAAVHVV